MSDAQPTAEKGLIRTLLVAAAIALVCSTAVTTAVQFLRPVQAAYSNLERNTAIVRAAYGRNRNEAQIIDDFLALHIVYFDPTTNRLLPAAAKPPAEHLVSIYVLNEAAGTVFVFPVTAKGMWSDIKCYVALDANASSIVRLEIFEHGETPGIGDRIEEPQWLASFKGKQLYSADGLARLHVGTDSSISENHQVDAISGATISSAAIGNALRGAFGPGGYADIRAQLLESFAAQTAGGVR